MQVGKESLEHLLLPSSHDTTENAHTSHSDKSPGLFAFLLCSAAIALSFLSGVNLQNHETFCKGKLHALKKRMISIKLIISSVATDAHNHAGHFLLSH